ncbi:MAG: flagellar hook-associated protein FlgK [Halanaerobiales bacterium]
MSTFGGIELGKRALQTQQKSLNITGHNIANANNEKYSRQRAIQSATDPYTLASLYNPAGAGQIGTGVYIKSIERMRDQFIDTRIRYENQGYGEWSVRKENLRQIESIYNELDSGGIKNNLDRFFQSFHDLVRDAESSNSVRESVIQTAITLTTQLNHIDRSLMEFRAHLGSEIEYKVAEVNDLTKRIAALNKQIKIIESDPTKKANDLADERDALIDELSKIIDIQVRFDSFNQANISLNGIAIVSGITANELEYTITAESRTSVDGVEYENVFDKYTFFVNGNEARIESGEIYGLMLVREDIVDQKMNKLDLLARTLINEVNAIHRRGYGKRDLPPAGADFEEGGAGRDFFLGTDASNIKVNDDPVNGIIGFPENIAAAPRTEDKNNDGENDLIGDQSIALEIAQLRDKSITALGSTSFNDFWQTQVSELGIEISRAEAMETNQNILLESLKEKRQEVSGVNLDEEMTEMIKFQHGYSAAARVISVIDQMLDTLINGMI